ncbi:MAG: TrkA C-terminal domain-containing protein [Arhodomonas sp.]|nr:TrkA C-terminal domain-containing protein [Arhodomonas sp.]
MHAHRHQHQPRGGGADAGPAEPGRRGAVRPGLGRSPRGGAGAYLHPGVQRPAAAGQPLHPGYRRGPAPLHRGGRRRAQADRWWTSAYRAGRPAPPAGPVPRRDRARRRDPASGLAHRAPAVQRPAGVRRRGGIGGGPVPHTRAYSRPADQVLQARSGRRDQRCLVEAVVSNRCPLVGKSVRDGRFRTEYNAAVMAVARGGRRLRGKIGDIVLQAGDTLLLETHPSFLDVQRNGRDFFLVSGIEDSTPRRHEQAPGSPWPSCAGMVAAAATGVLTMLNAALLAAAA